MARRARSLKTLFSNIASGISSWWGGGYNATDPRRKLIDLSTLIRANRQSANELLSGALPALRAHCRHLERNNPTARAAISGLKALVVGTGIALEPRGDGIGPLRDAWQRWIKNCGINGESLYEIQALSFAEVVTAGECLWRYVVLPELAERGEIPLRIVVLDPEWLVDEAQATPEGLTCVAGIDLDRYGRPVAYRLRNPSALGSGDIERVPAGEINHRFERRRALQNRGEPWMAPIIETLMNERDLVDVELYAARQSAAPALVIESQQHDDADETVNGTSDDPVANFKLGGVFRLYPGEKLNAHSHTRPSQQIAPFRQMLRGDTAAAMRLPQRFLDRDVGRFNYSAGKCDQIDTHMLLGPLRDWFGHATAGDAFAHVMPWLQLATGQSADAVDYEIIPDEVPYLDPVKDATGALMALAGGLTTWEAEIGKRGGDARKVLEQLRKEVSDPLLGAIFAAQLKQPAPQAKTEQDDEPAAKPQESSDAA